MYEKVLVVSGKPSWKKEQPLCGLPRSGGVFGSAQGIMGMASTLPSVLCTKSLMFPWSIVRYPLITRRRVFYQTLETPYSRNEATIRECQRELSQILKSISPLTVEKKVCVSVCEKFYSPKEMKGLLPV